MDETVIRMSTAWRLLRRRWRLLVALALVGAVLGALASLLLPREYAATAKVLVRGTSDEEALVAEAQIATSLIVLDRTAGALGLEGGGAGLRDAVAVTPADGNVLVIRAAGPTPTAARDLAARVTDEYIRFSGELAATGVSETIRALTDVREVLELRVVDLNARVGGLGGTDPAAPAAGELDRLETELAETTEALDGVDGVLEEAPAGSRGSIGVIEPAAQPVRPMPPTTLHLVAGGAGLLPLLGALAVLVARARDDRLRRGPDIAAALGGPILGTVPDQPGTAHQDASGEAAGRTWQARIRWMLREDRRWDLPAGAVAPLQRAAETRYRQVLARFRSTADPSRPLLVVVHDDDAHAQHAVARLAVVAAVHGPPVCVLTDEPDLQALVRVARGPDEAEVAVTVAATTDGAPPRGRVVLRVVTVTAARPVVPKCGPVAGALVVLTAGARTGWELVGLAEACADAGHPVAGALLVAPFAAADVSTRPEPPPAPTQPRNGRPVAGVTGR